MDLEAALGAGEGADPRYDRARSLVTALVGAARDRRAGSAPSPDLREQLATARAARGTGEPVENVFLGFLERSLAAAAEPAHVPPRDAGELLVQRHGLWFQPPGEDRVSCHARQALRLLLVALATSRIERPGDPSGLDALRDAGWPGEKMTPVSARNRIKQSIAVLRRLGAHVEWVEGGYLFSPALRIRLVD